MTNDEDAKNWTDLREDEASKILDATYQDPALGKVRQAVQELWEPLTETLSRRLPAPYAGLLDDIAADLMNSAVSRAVFGAGDHFFDLLWDVYQKGGWPVGWEGNYPDGRLVVYQPTLAK